MQLQEVTDIEFRSTVSYDLVVTTCGYERRSSFAARSGLRGRRKVAVRHPGPAGLSYGANRELLAQTDWTIADQQASLAMVARGLDGGARRFAVDISSMPRRFVAELVRTFTTSDEPAEVDWLYSAASFGDSALAASAIQPLTADPVSDFFGGAIRSPQLPVGLILGLGLEAHRAIGLMELLEPARVWAMLGQSDEPRFAAEALSVNREILELPTTTLLPYPVTSVAATFSALESLVFSSQDEFRLVIAPSGPKVFGLAALLVGATSREPRPAVWRVGSHGDSVPMDIVESGTIVATHCVWGS